ncbi:MAG: hypothetical protein J0H01_25230 [Rhizobiales bacterium]|nr:hypothetical protein [Hyphomicrobiales bacterium]
MDVLITGEPEKLPPEIRALVDAQHPVPADTDFFEQAFSLQGLLFPAFIGVTLAVLGALMLVMALVMLVTLRRNTVYDSLTVEMWLGGAGFTFLFAGWMMLGSLKTRYRLIGRQKAGERTRYGLFLTGDSLVSNSLFQTTVIPRPAFRGLSGGAFRYEFRGEVKSETLPGALVCRDRPALEAAIRRWASVG